MPGPNTPRFLLLFFSNRSVERIYIQTNLQDRCIYTERERSVGLGVCWGEGSPATCLTSLLLVLLRGGALCPVSAKPNRGAEEEEEDREEREREAADNTKSTLSFQPRAEASKRHVLSLYVLMTYTGTHVYYILTYTNVCIACIRSERETGAVGTCIG